MKKFLFKFSILLIAVFSFSSSKANNVHSFVLNDNSIDELIAHIMCQYPISLSEEQLYAFMSQMLTEAEGCDPVKASRTESLPKSESFKWKKNPMAQGYEVRSLGLRNGVKTRDYTRNPQYKFEQLNLQPYVFGFMTDCLGTLGVASIIIVDKDVGIQDDQDPAFPLAICEEQGAVFSFEEEDNCSIIESYNFQWANNCDINKYKFNLTGNLPFGVPYDETFWAIKYTDETAPEEGSLILLPCDDNYNDAVGFAPQYIADQGKFIVNFTSLATHVYNTNPTLNLTDVTASIVGCINLDGEALKTNLDQSKQAITLYPNPVDSWLQVELNTELNDESEIIIVNQFGQNIYRKSVSNQKYSSKMEIDVSDLDAGLYYLQLIKDGKNAISKFAKQ